MASTINSTDTGSGGLITTGDSSDELQLQTAEVARVTLTNTAVVVNESGADVDFRVEGDTDANLLFVDASTDRVGIGTSTPSGKFEVSSASAGVTVGDFFVDTANKAVYVGRLSSTAADNSSFIVRDRLDSVLLKVDTQNLKVGIGTSSPSDRLQVNGASAANTQVRVVSTATAAERSSIEFFNNTVSRGRVSGSNDFDGLTLDSSTTESAAVIRFRTGGGTLTERMRITSTGTLCVATTDVNPGNNTGTDIGAVLDNNGKVLCAAYESEPAVFNRTGNDGGIVSLRQDGTEEGSISVSGSTVSYNGGHLSRWAQMLTKPDLLKGTVMSNLDDMNVYVKPTLYWTEEDELPVDEEGNPTVAVGDVKEETSVSDNEQLNKVKVSDVEGDPNVAGVFVNWEYDEAHQVDEINMAMTGDMIIRIAEGVTVARGDLLMSAGDGTAKPQGDDIVRSKTIAKVTSTHVTRTYEDGSYCVPCVLMAC